MLFLRRPFFKCCSIFLVLVNFTAAEEVSSEQADGSQQELAANENKPRKRKREKATRFDDVGFSPPPSPGPNVAGDSPAPAPAVDNFFMKYYMDISI